MVAEPGRQRTAPAATVAHTPGLSVVSSSAIQILASIRRTPSTKTTVSGRSPAGSGVIGSQASAGTSTPTSTGRDASRRDSSRLVP